MCKKVRLQQFKGMQNRNLFKRVQYGGIKIYILNWLNRKMHICKRILVCKCIKITRILWRSMEV